jgi:retron-type reverse transcriptase
MYGFLTLQFSLNSCKILIEFRIPMKLVRIIKIRLNETYSKIRVRKQFFCAFSIQNGLKQGDTLSPLLVNFSLDYINKKV